nr:MULTISPECIES: GTP cyclohydrolase II [Acinetobacter]
MQFYQCSIITLYFSHFQDLTGSAVPIEFVATSRLPTAHGEFKITVFQDPKTGEEHVALSKGLEEVSDEPVVVRVHSECLTGDAFASLKCDCGPQLQATLKLINELGRGAILYLRQEGRGIGLTNKIRAYALQDQGHDTVDANLMLNLPADARQYDMCSIMLDHLQVKAVRLVTNNPLKIEALKAQGINVVDRVPLTVGLNPFNEQYLKTKHERMAHLYQKDDF